MDRLRRPELFDIVRDKVLEEPARVIAGNPDQCAVGELKISICRHSRRLLGHILLRQVLNRHLAPPPAMANSGNGRAARL